MLLNYAHETITKLALMSVNPEKFRMNRSRDSPRSSFPKYIKFAVSGLHSPHLDRSKRIPRGIADLRSAVSRQIPHWPVGLYHVTPAVKKPEIWQNIEFDGSHSHTPSPNWGKFGVRECVVPVVVFDSVFHLYGAACRCRPWSVRNKIWSYFQLKRFTIRYDGWRICTCAQRLANSQLNLPHETKQKD